MLPIGGGVISYLCAQFRIYVAGVLAWDMPQAQGRVPEARTSFRLRAHRHKSCTRDALPNSIIHYINNKCA